MTKPKNQPKRERLVAISAKIPASLYTEMKATAQRLGLKKTEALRLACREFISTRQQAPTPTGPLAHQIKRFRQEHNLSQAAAAAALGLNTRTLQNWEAERNRPPAATMTLLLKAMEDYRPAPPRT